MPKSKWLACFLLLACWTNAHSVGDTWKALNERLNVIAEDSEHPERIGLLERMLRAAKSEFGPKHLNVAKTLDLLAAEYTNTLDCGHAEPIQRQSLQIKQALLGTGDARVADALDTLSFCVSLPGTRPEEEEQLYKRILAIREKAPHGSKKKLTEALFTLGNFYKTHQRYKEAEELYRRITAIVEKIKGPQHPDALGTLFSLANIYELQGRFAEAEPLYQRLLNGLSLTEDASRLQFIRLNLARNYARRGMTDLAETQYLAIVEMGEKLHGVGSPHDIGYILAVADFYAAVGKPPQAEAYYERALAAMYAAPQIGPNGQNVPAALSGLGDAYSAQGRLDDAQPLYLRAIAIMLKTFNLDSPMVQEKLAALYRKVGRKEDADLIEKQLSKGRGGTRR